MATMAMLAMLAMMAIINKNKKKNMDEVEEIEMRMRAALRKIPGWKELEPEFLEMCKAGAQQEPVEPLADDKFEATDLEFVASLNEDLEVDFSELPAPPPLDLTDTAMPVPGMKPIKTTKITIRVPTAVLMAFKAKSKSGYAAYQTLMNRALKAAAKG